MLAMIVHIEWHEEPNEQTRADDCTAAVILIGIPVDTGVLQTVVKKRHRLAKQIGHYPEQQKLHPPSEHRKHNNDDDIEKEE